MSTGELLISQLKTVDLFTNKIGSETSEAIGLDKGGLHTDINWQLGHILISKFFLLGSCTFEDVQDIKETLELKRYSQLYSKMSDPKAEMQRIASSQILKDLRTLNQMLYPRVLQLNDEELSLESLKPHPIATTKLKAIEFSGQHQMWHNGQMALLKKNITKKSVL